MTLRLSDLEAPLDDVEFPDGSVHTPIPFGPTEYKLWRELPNEADHLVRGQKVVQILRACYPTATDDNWGTCTERMVFALIGHAARKIDMVRDALKNAVAVAPAAEASPNPAAATPPSSPKTNGATSSRSTRKRSAKTGGASTTANPTDVPNSSGSPITASTIPGASIRFAANSTTSTVPA